MRTRIKICGITREQDAELVAQSGADAMGMIFYDSSPRNVSLSKAKAICQLVQPYVTSVAVVVNPEDEFINQIQTQVAIDRIQFHGDEDNQACSRFSRPFYKALRVKDDADLIKQAENFTSASAFLLDAYVKGIKGGTGQSFDWKAIDYSALKKPIILAGGLDPGNVYQAILTVKPYAVDVSTGVEIKPGIKDAVKVNEFIIAVHEADNLLSKKT